LKQKGKFCPPQIPYVCPPTIYVTTFSVAGGAFGHPCIQGEKVKEYKRNVT